MIAIKSCNARGGSLTGNAQSSQDRSIFYEEKDNGYWYRSADDDSGDLGISKLQKKCARWKRSSSEGKDGKKTGNGTGKIQCGR